MIAVFKHELRIFFNTLTAYLFCAFILAFVGVGTMLYNIRAAIANFEYVLDFVSLGLVIILPVLTMRTLSEEKKQRTDTLLYSLPLKTRDILLGKYLALLVIFLIPTLLISTYPLIFSRYGEVFLPTSYGSLFAFFLLGAALIAIGVFISSLTENQGFAAAIGIAVMLLNYYSVKLSATVSTSAVGSFVAVLVLCVLLGLLARLLTKNDRMALIVSGGLLAASVVVFLVDKSLFESLVPTVMEKLSLFDRLPPWWTVSLT